MTSFEIRAICVLICFYITDGRAVLPTAPRAANLTARSRLGTFSYCQNNRFLFLYEYLSLLQRTQAPSVFYLSFAINQTLMIILWFEY